MNAGDIMTSNVVTVRSDTGVSRADLLNGGKAARFMQALIEHLQAPPMQVASHG
jgi:hypothetical protein